MDNNSDDKENTTTTEGVSSPVADQSPDSARRRFTRSAVVGGVVVASLGNRAAWGQATPVCMSQSILASFVDAGGQFLSAHPDGQHDPEVADAIFKADETYMDGTKVCIGPAPAGTPEGNSLFEGNVGKKGKRSVNANEYRNSLLDGGALDDGPLNGGPRR